MVGAIYTREMFRERPEMITVVKNRHYGSELYKKMEESDNYYHMENEVIMGRRNMVAINGSKKVEELDGSYYVYDYTEVKEDTTAANNKVPHGFHYELVNQCKNFLAGQPVRVSWKHVTPDDDFKLELDRILNDYNDWGTFNQIMIKDAQKYSKAFARVAIHPITGRLRFVPISPKDVVPFYDDFGDMYTAIRFYKVEELTEDGSVIDKEYAEVLDHSMKDTYDISGTTPVHVSEEPLLQRTIEYGNGESRVEDLNWGKVPIIEWRFTDDGINALEPIKHFIDLADANISDYANDLDDINELIWVLKGYPNQDLGEFMKDMKERKAIKVGQDGDVRAERNELPYQARKELYEIIIRNIYRFGRGIDFTDRSNLGNITGTGLKWSYELLEEKANELEQNGQKALDDLFYFIFKYMEEQGFDNDYDATNVEFLFDRSLMINEAEMMDNTLKFSQVGSLRTALEHNRWVDDVDEELIRINEDDESWEISDDRPIERDSYAEEIIEDDEEVPQEDIEGTSESEEER